jgi:hypothetical protein
MRTAPPTVRMSQRAGPVFMNLLVQAVDSLLKSTRCSQHQQVVLPALLVRGRLQKHRQGRPHRRAPIRTRRPLPPPVCPNCSPRRKILRNPWSQAASKCEHSLSKIVRRIHHQKSPGEASTHDSQRFTWQQVCWGSYRLGWGIGNSIFKPRREARDPLPATGTQ